MVASDKRKWLALGLLSVVQFMVVLDIAIVNVALPSIQTDLAMSQDSLQWVVIAYALMLRRLPDARRPAGRPGRTEARAVLRPVVFTVASLLAGLADEADR